MIRLPASPYAPDVLRTDFSDDAAWARLCTAIAAPVHEEGSTGDGFLAQINEYVSDVAFDGVTIEQLQDGDGSAYQPTFLFVADAESMTHPDQPVWVVPLGPDAQTDRPFRIVPTSVQSIENNLTLCNMDWRDFAEHPSLDGIFRGF